MRFSDVLRFNVDTRGEKIAYTMGERIITHRELRHRVCRLAYFLAESLERGGRVCVVLPNSLIYPEIYFACAQVGLIIVPIGPQLTESDVTRVFAECEPALIITNSSQAEKVRGAINRSRCESPVLYYTGGNPEGAFPENWTDYSLLVDQMGQPVLTTDVSASDDPAVILFTSGTTGRPKGVVHSQANFIRGAQSVVISLGLNESGRALQVLPISGINFAWVLSFYMAGMETVVIERFDATEVPKRLEQDRITHTVVAPIMLDLMARDAGVGNLDFSSLEMLGYGGSRMPREVAIRAANIFGPVLRQMYGQTETAGLLTSKPQHFHETDLISAGPPLLGVELRILGDDGRDITSQQGTGKIQVRVGYSLLGYWRRDDIRAPSDGWLATGDTGSVTSDGRLIIMGRVDDMIVTGGSNVFPREVEDVLMQHDHVQDVAVVGIPDDTWGERVTAFVVGKPGVPHDLLEETLKNLCTSELASPKKPRGWCFVDVLPRNATGKVLKSELVKFKK